MMGRSRSIPERLASGGLAAVAAAWIAGCALGPRPELRTRDGDGMRAIGAWVVAVHAAPAATIRAVPDDSGGTRTIVWTGDASRKAIFRDDVAHALRTEHGLGITGDERTAEGRIALEITIDPMSNAVRSVDVLFTNMSGDSTYARLHVPNARQRGDFDLASHTASEIARALSPHPTTD
ncbi:MAG: hypothetical protein ACOC9N_00705 [Gemmatimonadota bacterium]